MRLCVSDHASFMPTLRPARRRGDSSCSVRDLPTAVFGARGGPVRDDLAARGDAVADTEAPGNRGGSQERPDLQPSLSPVAQLGLDVLIGVVARLVLVGTTAYRNVDAGLLAAWARTMHNHGLREFYAVAPLPDHLPGDMWVLKGVESAYTVLGGSDFASAGFEATTNAVPVVADVVV